MINFCVDRIFTTSSKEYFLLNGIQLAKSLLRNTNLKITVYSEDDLSEFDQIIHYKPLRYREEVLSFNKKFKTSYGESYQFLPYMLKMDLWFFKIAAQLQHVEENPNVFSLFLDSDSVVLNEKFCHAINAFVEPALDFDVGVFRRKNTYLHPETGFLTLRSSERLKEAYESMFENVLTGEFRNLPSWTDSSLIENAILQSKISCLDFCEQYKLKTNNPVYESILSKTYVHLKGSRKGKFNSVKHALRRYR
jgi:hypothetical protein